MASTGVASTMTRETAYMAQTKSGNRNQLMPGMRRLWMVTMKLSPVRIEEKPVTKTPVTTRNTLLLENSVEKGT